MKVVFPNPYGFPLPAPDRVHQHQRAQGFSYAYRDFLLTQNGFSAQALSKAPDSETYLIPAERPPGKPLGLRVLYGMDTTSQDSAPSTTDTNQLAPVFLPIGAGEGSIRFVEVLAGRHRGYIASLDLARVADTGSLHAYLARHKTQPDTPSTPDALADALCHHDLNLVRLHAATLTDFLTHSIGCDDDLHCLVSDAPSVQQSARRQSLADLLPVIQPFSEVESRLPTDCWAVARNQHNQGELAREPVIVIDESLTLGTLDLDDPLGDGTAVFLVVVQGDLDIDIALLNDDIDGATSLIVTGNLRCRNAAVGGQEIYVGGHLDVHGLFWGDYDHGRLLVGGNATMAMCVASDGYDVVVRGDTHFARWIIDEKPDGENWRLDDAEALAEYIQPEFILAEDEIPTLERQKILAAMAQGRNIIHTVRLDDGGEIDRLFPSRAIAPDTLKRIAHPGWLPAADDDAVLGSATLDDQDVTCRIDLLPGGKQTPQIALHVQRGKQLALYVALFNGPVRWWDRVKALLQRKPLAQHMQSQWHSINPDTDWAMLNDQSPPDARQLLQQGWTMALHFAAAQSLVQQAMSPTTLRALLALPLAEPYNDFDSDDRNGLWVGNVYCAFRQENAATGDTALLRVSVEDNDTNLYFYEIVPMADGSEAIEVRFSPDLDPDEDSVLIAQEGPALNRALRLFRMANRHLLAANTALLAGEAVCQDGFALQHWRKKGYLKKRA